MRKSTRRELNKLRELFWFLIHGKRCALCKKLFVEKDAYAMARHGDATGAPLSLKITIDHRDRDHSNNDPGNHRLTHQSCHKSYHAYEILHNRKTRHGITARRRNASAEKPGGQK